MALYGLGLVAVGRNESQQAARHLREALALFNELRNDLDVALCLEGLALVDVSQGRAAQAARLRGASDTLHETLRLPLFSNCEARHERGVAAARAQLGEAAFAAAWAEGRSQPCRKVVADVLRECSSESD